MTAINLSNSNCTLAEFRHNVNPNLASGPEIIDNAHNERVTNAVICFPSEFPGKKERAYGKPVNQLMVKNF